MSTSSPPVSLDSGVPFPPTRPSSILRKAPWRMGSFFWDVTRRLSRYTRISGGGSPSAHAMSVRISLPFQGFRGIVIFLKGLLRKEIHISSLALRLFGTGLYLGATVVAGVVRDRGRMVFW